MGGTPQASRSVCIYWPLSPHQRRKPLAARLTSVDTLVTARPKCLTCPHLPELAATLLLIVSILQLRKLRQRG